MDERLRRPRLVGRTPELALLGERLRTASAGVPAAVAIGGAEGSGKSRLLHEFLASMPAGTRALLGRCFDGSDPPVPFAPLLDAFRSFPEGGPGGLPAATRRLPRVELFDLLLRRLDALARDRPVVLVLEDLHRADPSTRDLTAFLAGNLWASRTLVVVTWCSERLPGAADLRHYVAGLAADAGATRIDLGPLPRAHLAAVLADASGGRVDAAVERDCCCRAEGNPFFALELLAAAARAHATGCTPAPLPDTLVDLLRARLDVLGPRARQVVRAAAAAGRRVDHRVLAAAIGMPADELFAALHEAVERQVLVPTDDGQGYRFRQALLHEVAVADLLPGERRHLLGGCLDVPFPPPRLTPRELQVLSLVATGQSNRTIAEELFIAEKTASVHVSNILAKLGARSRTAAAATAHRLGLDLGLSPDSPRDRSAPG